MKKQDQNSCKYPRLLTSEEADNLLKDAKDSSAWMRAEIKRRRAEESGSLIIKEKQ
ncbi:MAG: hypothetical protein JAZ20_10785 [Candidatus Thiodiazotropha weberae]|nr:hypothetical protein [Candidatus Thiodiazotropha lotti]MCG8013911.1 hypothetical protein [Candidatus Thiodiazotropha lotti]MCG8020896.1 hypothetical protein [Candidatus Thiodiazotropha lotti]MCW4208062.1 hypothetical protein [Candidatus Thiodiazotropha lotti]MCW4213392.1 hypothetical protein [Candidatus Thiodiazotropha lotti]